MIAFITLVLVSVFTSPVLSTFELSNYGTTPFYPKDAIHFDIAFYEAGPPVDHEIRIYEVVIPYLYEDYTGGIWVETFDYRNTYGADDSLFGNGWILRNHLVALVDGNFGDGEEIYEASLHLMKIELWKGNTEPVFVASRYILCLPD